AFGTATAEMVAGRHLVIYARDPSAQALLSRLGATGRLVGAGNPLAIVWNTTGIARSVVPLRRPTSVGIILDADGLARMRTVIDLEDQAPNGPPSVQLGKPFGPQPVGGYAADVSVYLPRSAEHVDVEPSSPTTTETSVEAGLHVATGALFASPSAAMSMTVSAQIPQAVTQVGDLHQYRLVITPAPTAVDDPLRVTIRIPDGMAIASTSEG